MSIYKSIAKAILFPTIVALVYFSLVVYKLEEATPRKATPVKGVVVERYELLNPSIDKVKAKFTKDEEYMYYILSKTIWCEDRKSIKSMQLVLSVLYNRAEEKTLKGLYKEAIKPHQFECISKKLYLKQVKAYDDLKMLEEARKLVDLLLINQFSPITNATHFINPNTLKVKPKWVNKMKVVLKYENHVYMVHKNSESNS